jgi:anti-sigma-K factor RskA
MSAQREPPSEPQGFDDETVVAYVLGRLSPQAAAALERRAASHAALAAEIALVRGLAHAEASRQAPRGLELGWARLSRAVDAEAKSRPRRWLTQPRFAAWQLAAAAAAVLVLTIGIGDLYPTRPETEAVYQTAGSDQGQAFAVQVAFAPSAREQDMRAALVQANAQLVSGPSALGLYVLVFRDEAARTEGMARLRQRPEVFETVSALDPPTAR